MFLFSKNNKAVDAHPYIRRICDLTTPNLATTADSRAENRYNRRIPTLLGAWRNETPEDGHVFAITSDIADGGLGLVLSQPFRADEVVLGYWISREAMEEPWFFLGNIHRNQPIGGGYWAVGVELREFANRNYDRALAPLKPMAEKLLAPTAGGFC